MASLTISHLHIHDVYEFPIIPNLARPSFLTSQWEKYPSIQLFSSGKLAFANRLYVSMYYMYYARFMLACLLACLLARSPNRSIDAFGVFLGHGRFGSEKQRWDLGNGMEGNGMVGEEENESIFLQSSIYSCFICPFGALDRYLLLACLVLA